MFICINIHSFGPATAWQTESWQTESEFFSQGCLLTAHTLLEPQHAARHLDLPLSLPPACFPSPGAPSLYGLRTQVHPRREWYPPPLLLFSLIPTPHSQLPHADPQFSKPAQWGCCGRCGEKDRGGHVQRSSLSRV